MGNIIKFPKYKRRNKNDIDILSEKLIANEQYNSSNNARFTCSNCGNIATFIFIGVIFKDCRFYCEECGAGYKLDNPNIKNKDTKTK